MDYEMRMPDNGAVSKRPSRRSSRASRVFSPDVMAALEKAIAAYKIDAPSTDEDLRLAVMTAAREARSLSWRPEELVAALHALVAVSNRPEETREALYAVLKRRALVLYFGAHESGA
jgi:hypothetical protein